MRGFRKGFCETRSTKSARHTQSWLIWKVSSSFCPTAHSDLAIFAISRAHMPRYTSHYTLYLHGQGSRSWLFKLTLRVARMRPRSPFKFFRSVSFIFFHEFFVFSRTRSRREKFRGSASYASGDMDALSVWRTLCEKCSHLCAPSSCHQRNIFI